MLRFLKKIVSRLYLGVVLILVCAFVFWGSRNGWGFAAILSGSMEPVYNVGGIVVVRPVDAQTLKIGDAISFKEPGFNVPICHRIIDIRYKDKQKYFVTKGDANEEADRYLVPLADVNGKVILHLPYVGRLVEVKSLGATELSVLGRQFPAGGLLVLVVGLLFIGLLFKEHLEDIVCPSRRWRREAIKKQHARLLNRRQAFKIR
jgi:signal peptidase